MIPEIEDIKSVIRALADTARSLYEQLEAAQKSAETAERKNKYLEQELRETRDTDSEKIEKLKAEIVHLEREQAVLRNSVACKDAAIKMLEDQLKQAKSITSMDNALEKCKTDLSAEQRLRTQAEQELKATVQTNEILEKLERRFESVTARFTSLEAAIKSGETLPAVPKKNDTDCSETAAAEQSKTESTQESGNGSSEENASGEILTGRHEAEGGTEQTSAQESSCTSQTNEENAGDSSSPDTNDTDFFGQSCPRGKDY